MGLVVLALVASCTSSSVASRSGVDDGAAPSQTSKLGSYAAPSPTPSTSRSSVSQSRSTAHQPIVSHAPPARAVRPVYAQCLVPAGVTAAQVVLVRSSGVSATVWACTRTGSGYRRDLGPFYGHVGYTGVIAASSKREGDGHTPAGVYSLLGGFGLRSDPGLAQGWAPVHHGDVWVDDPGSPDYNLRETGPADGRWRSAESLEQPGPYDYAQVIGYNLSRTPGRGSAIFLHVDTGGSTAGCVAVPAAELLSIFRWERSGAVISIS
jgi:L,D-peptidoglycan transpeptidase YkuD (ErfK/YbiS/YcfS/YnhG family)